MPLSVAGGADEGGISSVCSGSMAGTSILSAAKPGGISRSGVGGDESAFEGGSRSRSLICLRKYTGEVTSPGP